MKGKGGRRSATSDWMAMEQQRGISITSTVLQFNYRDCVVNLLDTPGHRDFSEDTYRVLAGCDGAVMVLDAAKGIEPQTLKLFEVCRDRGLPLLSFVNKWDRPALEPLAVLDDIESQLGLIPTPVTWPVGADTDFRGVIDRRDPSYTHYSRTTGGARRPGGGPRPRPGRGTRRRAVGAPTRSSGCSTRSAPSSTSRPSSPASPPPPCSARR